MGSMKNVASRKWYSLSVSIGDIKWVAWIALCSVVSSLAFAGDSYKELPSVYQSNRQTAENSWRAMVYEPINDYGVDPALLCFGRSDDSAKSQCLKLVGHVGSAEYPFQSVKSVEFVDQEAEIQKGLALVSAVHYGTSEPLVWLSIWEINDSSISSWDSEEPIILALQSTYKVMLCGSMSSDRIGYVVTANRIWNASKETLFGPHHFFVSIYEVDSKRRSMRIIHSYRTRSVYEVASDQDAERVLDAEAIHSRKLCK